jgi:exosortase O
VTPASFFSPGPRASAGPTLAGGRGLLLRGVLLAAWAVASASPLHWLAVSLSQPTHAVQRTVLLGLAGLGLWDFLTRPPAARVSRWAAPTAVFGLAVMALARLGTVSNTVHATAALFMLFALSAGFLEAQVWRRRLILLAVVLLCLPVQTHIDAHLGLPLRLWTAGLVAPLLQSLGVPNVSVESVIVTENGIADVASACSGVRTLWYALALWLCAGLAWPHAARWRWALAGLLGAGAAVGLNALRVGALVWALDQGVSPLLIEIAHASLGLLALVLVGGINLALCRGATPRPAPAATVLAAGWRPQLGLAALIAGVALLPGAVRDAAPVASAAALHWPAAFQAQPLPLSRTERDLMVGNQSQLAEKQRFDHQGLRGSLIVVQSRNWRAHHAPELCLLAHGARIDQLTRVGTPAGEFRVMRMQSGTQTAITWFQAGGRVVPDLGSRLWAGFLQPDETWSLVTVVVDAAPTEEAVLQLHRAVRDVLADDRGAGAPDA